MNRRLIRLYAAVYLLCLLSVSCVSHDSKDRLHRHGIPSLWGEALLDIGRDPWQLSAAGLLAVGLPVAFANDARASEHMIEATYFSNHASNGDRVLQAMMAAAGAYGLTEWALGDGGQSTEVLVESGLVTAGIVQIFKDSKSRRRPRGSNSYDSFLSGHAAFASVLATFLARRVDDAVDDWRGKLGYLFYVPALAVMVNRVEKARHYPSDVVAGALLGTLVTNLFYNAHYGSDSSPGIFGTGLMVEPWANDDGAGIGLSLRF